MIAPIDAPTLCARLDALRDEIGSEAILAFDADGTLWQGDVTRDLVSFAMSERPLLPDGLPRLRAIAAQHRLPLADEIHAQLAGLVLSYSMGQLSDAEAVKSVVIAFAGHREATFEDFVVEAIQRANLVTRFRSITTVIFEWAAQRSLPIVVVSASPRLAVREALTAVGLSASAVLGVDPRVVDGRIAPELATPVLVGDAKVTALRAHTGAAVLAAFGDDVRDVPLLLAGRLAVGVHATDALLARSAEFGTLVVLGGA